jgi:hypothetical protein
MLNRIVDEVSREAARLKAAGDHEGAAALLLAALAVVDADIARLEEGSDIYAD